MKLFAVSAVNRLRWDDKRLPIYRHLTKYRPERTQGFLIGLRESSPSRCRRALRPRRRSVVCEHAHFARFFLLDVVERATQSDG